MRHRLPNTCVERTGTSRSAYLQSEYQWRLAPAAQAGSSAKLRMKLLSILVAVLTLANLACGQGSIVYSPFTFTGPGDWQPWDVNRDGTVDFTLTQSWIITQDVPTSGMSYSFGIRPTANNYVLGVGSDAAVLSASAEISLSPSEPGEWQHLQYGSLLVGFWSANLLQGTWSGWRGPIKDVQQGYLGLRFLATDGYHFGWLRVNGGGDGTLATIVPVDFAWETHTGAPISAGVVPEPSSTVLLVLGFGFMGVLSGRRLRR